MCIFRGAWATQKLDTVPLRPIGVNFGNLRLLMCGSSQEWQQLSEGAKINNCCQKSFQEAGCCSWREFEAGLVPRVARAQPRLCSQSKPRHQVTSTQVSLASSQTNSPRSDRQNKWEVGTGGEVMAQHSKISSWLFKG